MGGTVTGSKSHSARAQRYEIIDADGHIFEPVDLWTRYLDPEYRERAPTYAVDDDGREWLRVEDKVYATATAVGERWMDRTKGGFDPHARIVALDVDRIDAAFLYPTHGLKIGGVTDAHLAAALCRAYNRYIADFCSAYPDRLFGVAMLPLQSIELAIEELRYARNQLGLRAGILRPNPYTADLLPCDPAYDAFWSVAQELDASVAFHGGTGGMPAVGLDQVRDPGGRHIVEHTFQMMLTSLSVIWGGVCERFPRLRFGFLESGGAWILPWLERMDRHFAQRDTVAWSGDWLTVTPSEYFRRQCWISFEPVETTLPYVAERLGARKCLWATDYPHADGFFPGAPKMIADLLPNQAKRAVLALSAMDFYNL